MLRTWALSSCSACSVCVSAVRCWTMCHAAHEKNYLYADPFVSSTPPSCPGCFRVYSCPGFYAHFCPGFPVAPVRASLSISVRDSVLKSYRVAFYTCHSEEMTVAYSTSDTRTGGQPVYMKHLEGSGGGLSRSACILPMDQIISSDRDTHMSRR